MSYYVYIAQCADESFYCGYTRNLIKRLLNHNYGSTGAKYTRSRRPVKLVYYEELNNLEKALKREYQIKKLTRAQKLILIQS